MCSWFSETLESKSERTTLNGSHVGIILNSFPLYIFLNFVIVFFYHSHQLKRLFATGIVVMDLIQTSWYADLIEQKK